MRGPPKDTVVAMVKEAWNAVTREAIVSSFDACGLTTNDVDVIHCTKVGGLASAARDDLLSWQPNQADNSEDKGQATELESNSKALNEDEVMLTDEEN